MILKTTLLLLIGISSAYACCDTCSNPGSNPCIPKCAPPCEETTCKPCDAKATVNVPSVSTGAMAACIKRCQKANCPKIAPECPSRMVFLCKNDCNTSIDVYK